MPAGGCRVGASRTDRMRHSPSWRAALVFAALVLALPRAQAADISILGTWKIVEAIPAPWTRPEIRPALEAEGKNLLNLVVTFAAHSVKSKFKLFNCKSRVIYEANSLEADALFQGNLPEPNPTAAAAHLGFPKGDVPCVDVRCINETFTFHFRDPSTAMINLNRVIYTLKRQ
jgi:hypothetical protein